MINESNILINDSCVLIDLHDLGLLQDFFQLEYAFFTTSQVIMEITDNNQSAVIQQYVDKGILIVDSNGTFDSIQFLYDTYPGLSFADSSVLELASRIEGIILSSDKGLRNITKLQNLPVRGVLWIINEMVITDILSIDMAIEKLQIYPKINIRVPKNEINKLLQLFRNL